MGIARTRIGCLFHLVLLCAAIQSQALAQPNLLVLSSRPAAELGSPGFAKEILDIYRSQPGGGTLSLEGLDLDAVPEPLRLALGDFLSRKYAFSQLDAVLTLDTAAAEFWSRTMAATSLGQLPFAALGIDARSEALLSDDQSRPPDILVRQPDMAEGLLNLVLSILPDAERIIVVADLSEAGLDTLDHFAEALRERGSLAELLPLVGYSPPEVAASLAAAEQGSPVIFLSYEVGPTGERVSAQELRGLLTAAADLPTFSSWEDVSELGVLANFRPDYATQTRQVLDLLAEYLETGTAVMAEGTASPEVNLAIAERLGLKNRPFPQNTVFRGESTAEFWESVPVLVLLGATTAGVLLLIGFFARGTPRRADRGKSPKTPSASNGEQSQRDREYALIAEHSTDLISTQKLDGTYLFVSPASEELLGYASRDLVGTNPVRLIHPDDMPAIEKVRRLLRSGDGPHTVTCRMRRADGSYVWVEAISRIVGTNGEQEIIATTRDISERRRVQEALEEALNAARSAERAKTTFLANMSHEIRTPMNGILGFTSLLLETVKDQKSRDYLQLIEKSGSHLLEVINDILDLSRLESGLLRLNPQVVPVAEFLQEVLQYFKISAEQKGLALALIDPPEPAGSMVADPRRLRQILINLLGNAVKFTERGSVTLRYWTWNQTLFLEVSDTGIGMDEETMRDIFQPFRQGENTTLRKYGGTGLGLAICRRLADQMGGSLSVRSRPNEGSVFLLEIGGLIAGAQARSVGSATGAGFAIGPESSPRTSPTRSNGAPDQESVSESNRSPDLGSPDPKADSAATAWLETLGTEIRRHRRVDTLQQIQDWALSMAAEAGKLGFVEQKEAFGALASAATAMNIVEIEQLWERLERTAHD